MRTSICTLALLIGLMATAGFAAAGSEIHGTAPAASLALQEGQPASPPPQIDVDIDRSSEGVWYTSPVWIAIGAIALVVLVLLIITANRGGGGTTVVRG